MPTSYGIWHIYSQIIFRLVQHFSEVCYLPRLSEWSPSLCFCCLPFMKILFQVKCSLSCCLQSYKATREQNDTSLTFIFTVSASYCFALGKKKKMNKWNVPLLTHCTPKHWTALPEPPLVQGMFHKESIGLSLHCFIHPPQPSTNHQVLFPSCK